MNHRALAFIGVASILGSNALQAGGYSFDLTEPKVRVSIPDIPQLKMERHPLYAEKPHLQFMGSEGPISVSIITPTSDPNMTAKECAVSVANTLARQFEHILKPAQFFRGQINDHTFAILYGLPDKGFVQLHAQFVSAAYGTHCIQVHLSKVSHSKDDVAPWFKGFTSVDIEALNAQQSAPGDAPKAARP